MKKLLQAAVSVALLLTASASLTIPLPAQNATADVSELKERARVYREHITRQQRNIQLMTDEIQTNPDHPDTRKLGNFFATMAGVRTEAYKSAPPFIQTLIDRLESDKLLATMNAATMMKYPHNVAYGHFLVEIERSKKFIAMLRKQLKDTEKQIAEIAPTTTVNAGALASFLGTWKCVGRAYEIQIQGEDGAIQGLIKESTPPEKAFPYDYTVGSTMFDGGKMQSDGSIRANWAQYSWVDSNTNHRLKRGSAPVTLRLRQNNKTSMEVTGNHRVYEGKTPAQIHWTDELGSGFKYSFIKTD